MDIQVTRTTRNRNTKRNPIAKSLKNKEYKQTIINSKKIRENSHLPLGQLLGKFSGINFENLYSGVDVKSSVRIRGFGEQATRNVLILINPEVFNYKFTNNKLKIYNKLVYYYSQASFHYYVDLYKPDFVIANVENISSGR